MQSHNFFSSVAGSLEASDRAISHCRSSRRYSVILCPVWSKHRLLERRGGWQRAKDVWDCQTAIAASVSSTRHAKNQRGRHTMDLGEPVMIVSFIIPMVLLAPVGRAGEMHVEPTDYWTLSFSLPQDAASRAATRARVTLTQPQGYVQMLDAAVRREKGRLRWQVVYPLIDDGRFEAAPGTWSGYWKWRGRSPNLIPLLPPSCPVTCNLSTGEEAGKPVHRDARPVGEKSPLPEPWCWNKQTQLQESLVSEPWSTMGLNPWKNVSKLKIIKKGKALIL